MNDDRALKALRFEDIKDIDDKHFWADILSSKFLARVYDLEHIKCMICLAMASGKKFKVPRRKGQYYTFDMVSKEFCDIHEAFQHFRKKYENFNCFINLMPSE